MTTRILWTIALLALSFALSDQRRLTSVVAAPFDDLGPTPSINVGGEKEPTTGTTTRPRPIPMGGNVDSDLTRDTSTAEAWSYELRMQTPTIDAARSALKSGDVRKCLVLLGAAAKEDPSLPPDLLLLAQLYAAENRFQEATIVLEKAAANHKNHPEVAQVLGSLALAQGRNADAWVHFERALGLEIPSTWSDAQQRQFKISCISSLATVSERRKDWQAAETIYARWKELAPLNETVLERWAHALLQVGKPEAAFEKLAAMHRANPESQPPELALGGLYIQIGNFDSAGQWYERAAAKYPQDARVPFEHAGAALIVGQTKIARQQLDKALQTKTNLEKVGANLPLLQGWVARSEMRYAEAEQFFRETLRLAPGNPTALYHLPLVLIEQEDELKHQQALQIATIFAQKHPTSQHALTALGWVQFRTGQAAEAEALLVKAMNAGPEDGETMYYAAQVLLKNGKASAAAKCLPPLRKAIDAPRIFIPRDDAREWLASVALALE